jgi:uncharacterized protein (TIGR02147 family)
MDVFQYTDYRKFLQNWLARAKKETKFSAAQLAQIIGVHPTFLSQVLLGKKDFVSEHWINACEHFNLMEIEKDYLHFVFLKNRCGTPSGRKYYQRKIDEILKRRLQLRERMKEHRELNDEERATFYSSWLYSAIRLFCGIGKGQAIEGLSQKFNISKERTEEIVNFLIQLGLCQLERGMIQMGSQHVHVPANSLFVTKHHLNWRIRAIQSLDRIQENELHFTAPMAISKKDFSVIREKIVKLIQETIEVAKASEAEDLATLTIDFFWPLK